MNYFSQSDKAALALKFKARLAYGRAIDAARDRLEVQQATRKDKLDLFFLALSSRLLTAKFHAFPAYTNEELSYLVGCSSGTYLGLIMTRQKECSKDLALLMSSNLRNLERREGIQPIEQPPYPEN